MKQCHPAPLRVSADSVAYLPTERATFRQLRTLCPAARDTFIITPVDAVLEPALAFPFGAVTVIAVQTRNDPGPDPIRVVDEDALPDYWIVPALAGVTFIGLPLEKLTWGRLRKALGPGRAQLGWDVAGGGFCYLPNVIFQLDLGETSSIAFNTPDAWRPSDDLALVGVQVGRAMRDASSEFCP